MATIVPDCCHDPFDPNTWPGSGEGRIYADETLELFALVDGEDYPWAVQWCWCALRRPGQSIYLRRAIGGAHIRCRHSGVLVRNPVHTLYLHVEIMRRTGITPPEPGWTLVDHINRDSLDCRRSNLRWANRSTNRKNSKDLTRSTR